MPMQAMWNNWRQWGPQGPAQGYTMDWANGRMRHDATSDADPNSPTGNQTWQPIPQEWYQQRDQWNQWQGDNADKIQQSGGDPYAAYLRQWSDYYKPGFERPAPPNGLSQGAGFGAQSQGNGSQRYGSQGMPWGAIGGGALGGPIGAWAGNQLFGGGGGDWTKTGQGMGGPGQAGMEQMFGNIGDITGELAQQTRMDTLNSGLNVQRQWQEYGEGRGMEKYMRDLYGDILGVEFGDTNTAGVQDYMNRGMQGDFQPGYTGGPWGTVDPNAAGYQGPPVTGPDGGLVQIPGKDAPTEQNGGIPAGQGEVRMDSYSAGPSSVAPHTNNVPENPTEGGGQPGNDPYPNHVPQGSPPIIPQGPGGGGVIPGQGPVGPLTKTKVPAGSRFGAAPPVPNLPDSGYTMKNTAFDPGNDRSWGFLARPAQGIASDLDAQRAILARSMPAGGERNLAESNAINQSFGKIGDLRQGLVSEALGGINNMGQSKKFQVPNLGMSGSGQSLLGNYMQGRGQDQSYDLGLKNITSNEKMAGQTNWANLFASLGGSLADMYK